MNIGFDSKIVDGSVKFDLKRLDHQFCERSSTINNLNGTIPNDDDHHLILDARHLNIKRIFQKSNSNEQKSLEFQVNIEQQSLTIDLSSYKEENFVSIVIFYSTTTECTALQWLSKEQTADRQYPYMFSQCQAIHARSLYPCQDTPGVKTTYSAKVTCPKPLTVVN